VVVAWDYQSHPRPIPLEPAFELGDGVDVPDNREIRRRVEPRNQLAALRRVVLIDHHHRHVLDVGRRGIAEERQLDDRRDEDHAEEPRVLPQLQELFPHQVPEAAHLRPTLASGASRQAR
jgi:hypothetical protein